MPETIQEQLERLRSWSESTIPHEPLPEDRAAIQAALAIIDKLPKTKDGVPMVHLMEVATTRNAIFPNGAILAASDEKPVRFFVALWATNGMKVDWEYVYTVEAAEEAAKKGGDDAD